MLGCFRGSLGKIRLHDMRLRQRWMSCDAPTISQNGAAKNFSRNYRRPHLLAVPTVVCCQKTSLQRLAISGPRSMAPSEAGRSLISCWTWAGTWHIFPLTSLVFVSLLFSCGSSSFSLPEWAPQSKSCVCVWICFEGNGS